MPPPPVQPQPSHGISESVDWGLDPDTMDSPTTAAAPQAMAARDASAAAARPPAASPSPAPSGGAAAGAKTPRAVAMRRMLRALLWDTIDPGAAFRKQWDALLLLQLVFLVVEVPFVTAFAIEFRPHDPLGILEIIIDITFGLDIFLNFRTGILDCHTFHVNYHRRAIAVSYLRGWFLPDVLSALPYEWIFSSPHAGMVQLMKVARMAKLLRMLRLVKLLKMHRNSMLMHQIAYILGPNLLQLMQLTLAGMTLNHVVACLFYYAATLRHDRENWVEAYGISNASTSVKYTASLYFAVSTLGTVGFGDVRAVSTTERIVACVAIVIGITVFATVISTIGHLLEEMDGHAARTMRQLQHFELFLRKRDVPPHLVRRIAGYYRRTMARQLTPEETALLEELSGPLRYELVSFLFRELLDVCPFFAARRPTFVAAVAPYLRPECCEPGDVVIRQGETGDRMYFVVEGELEVMGAASGDATGAPAVSNCQSGSRRQGSSSNFDVPVPASTVGGVLPGTGNAEAMSPVLCRGANFGEYALLRLHRCPATIIARSRCDLYSLGRDALEDILAQWPELLPDFREALGPCARASSKAAAGLPGTGAALDELAASVLAKQQAATQGLFAARGPAGGGLRGAGGRASGAAAGQQQGLWRQWQHAATVSSSGAGAFGRAAAGPATSITPSPFAFETVEEGRPQTFSGWDQSQQQQPLSPTALQQQQSATAGAPDAVAVGGGPAAVGALPAVLESLPRRSSLQLDFGGMQWSAQGARRAEGAAEHERRGWWRLGRSSVPTLRPAVAREVPRSVSARERRYGGTSSGDAWDGEVWAAAAASIAGVRSHRGSQQGQ